MAMKEQPRQVYRSAKGKEVDMHKLIMQNEMTIAVGNRKVNARGDELGPGGKIIRTREQIQADAYKIAQPAQTVGSQRPATQSTPTVAESITKQIDQTAPQKKKQIDDMDPEGDE